MIQFLRNLRWQSQVWIRTAHYDICIGALPMYSSEPWGIWIGEDGKVPRFSGRFAPKKYRREWVWKIAPSVKHADSTIPLLVDTSDDPYAENNGPDEFVRVRQDGFGSFE